MLSTSPLGDSRQLTVENIVALTLAALVIALCVTNRWFDAICSMMQHNEIHQMDEMIGGIFVLLAAFVFMFARRDRQLREEARLLKASEAESRGAARRDFLTGSANRLALAEWLAARRGEAVTFITLDLDGFKAINDELGHTAGDAVLVEVAARLRRALDRMPGALVVRMGGDEFGCLIEQGEDRSGAAVATIRDSLDEPIIYHGIALRIAASIGMAARNNGDRSLDALLQDADTAMYRAKQERRARSTDGPAPLRPVSVIR